MDDIGAVKHRPRQDLSEPLYSRNGSAEMGIPAPTSEATLRAHPCEVLPGVRKCRGAADAPSVVPGVAPRAPDVAVRLVLHPRAAPIVLVACSLR